MEPVLGFLMLVGIVVLFVGRRNSKKKSSAKKSSTPERSAPPPKPAPQPSYSSPRPVNTPSVDDAQKKVTDLLKKADKLEGQYKSIKYAIDAWDDPEISVKEVAAKIKGVDPEEAFSAVSEADLKCMDVPDLKKLFRENQKEIKKLCAQYEKKYTTKTNAMMYRLMVLALEAELQNILNELKYGKLETGISQVRSLTTRYYAIVEEGNQSIAPTIRRFIEQLEYFYIEAVKIEYEYYVRVEQKRAEQKAIREQARQDAADRKANEALQKKLAEESKKYEQEIQRLTEAIVGVDESSQEYQDLKDQLDKVVALKDQVEEQQEEIANLQNGKAGTIYVISNVGAFGKDVFKVGMTRRFDPQERIDELSGASVPFPFDVHCTIFTEDAPALETKMHHRLDEMRVNKVNLRKEFFKISVDDLEAIVHEEDPTAVFHRTAAAEQYNQSQSSVA